MPFSGNLLCFCDKDEREHAADAFREHEGQPDAGDAEEMELSLEFLPEGRYVVDIYTDGVNADLNARDWKRSSMEVTRKSSLRFIMSRNGGMAGIIRKIK